MKKIFILTSIMLLFGAYQESQAYKIKWQFPTEYDSCYMSFAESPLVECANLHEMELKAGDTIWMHVDLMKNKDCQSRYGLLFFRLMTFQFAGIQIVDSIVSKVTIVDVGKPPIKVEYGKYAPLITPSGWWYFVPNENVDEDITLVSEIAPDVVKSNWFFDKEYCVVVDVERDDTLLSRSGYNIVSNKHSALHAKHPVKITPKEGYEITSISVDTTLFYRADEKYAEHLKYTKDDVPDNDWLELNDDGSVIVMLKGHLEVDGILHSKSWPVEWDVIDHFGYHVTIETAPKTGINETSINSKKISPNPANSSATLTLNLESAGDLRITLNDLLGNELFEIHNTFTDAGNFTKTFSTANLAKGTYYLKIFSKGSFTTEKLVVN